MAERTVSVKLQAKVDQYVGGMKKASTATKQLEKATEKARKEQYLMSKTAGVVGAAVVAAFAAKTIKAASDLNETLSKTNVVFKGNAASVQAWAKKSATAFGMSQNAAASAAATYGNLFVSLGLADDQAAKMSMNLVELAGDLASFNNIDPTEALDALRSGLVGETEPLRRLGVNMNDATLRAQALKMGLVATTKEALDPAVKAQAAYALILEQTTTAQGDFARTADGLANKQRILNAEWENAQAGLGEALLPAASSVLGVMNNMLGAFNAAPAPIKQTAVGVGILGAAFVLLAPRIVATKAAMAELGVTSTRLPGKFKTAAKALGLLTAAAAAGQMIFADADWKKASLGPEQAAAALEKLAEGGNANFGRLGTDLADLGEQLDNLASPNLAERLQDGVFSVFTGSEGRAGRQQFLMDLRVLDTALTGMVADGEMDQAKAALADIKAELEASGKGAYFDELMKNLPGYTDAVVGASRATGDMGEAAGDAGSEVKTLADALAEVAGTKQGVDSALSSLEASFDDAAEAVKGLKGATNDNRTALDLGSEAGRKAQAALASIKDNAFDAAEALGEAGASGERIESKMERARRKFIETATAAGLSDEAAERLADQYGLIPEVVRTAFKTTGAGKAEQDAKDIAKAQDEIRRFVQIRYDSGIVGPRPDRRASGGYISGPGSGTSDSIPAYLSNGEYVVRASAVSKYGRGTFDALNAGRYATGGPVRRKGRVGSRRFDFGDYADVRDSQRGSAALGFDFAAYGQAVDRAKNAALALTDARRRVNEASSPEEQAAAQRDLAAATMEVAEAEKAKAAAKPTSKNILQGFRDRAKKLDTFRKNLRTLAKKGLSGVILKQLLEAGIDEGGEMAAALVKDPSIIGELNKTQAAIGADARALAAMFGGKDSAGGTSGSSSGGTTGTSGTTSDAVVITFRDATKPIVLKMDSTQVWQGLLKLKRDRQGASLGLG